MNNDDLITSLGLEDTITVSSSDLYDWGNRVSAALTASSISSLDLTSAAPSVTLSPNAYPYSNVVPNGGYTLNSGAITGTLGSGLGLGHGSPAVNIWSDATNSSDNLSGKIDLKGENADITINGRSLSKTIQALEERLNMLRPNEHLEAEWDQLRELGEAYRKLEADLIEKQRAWNILKKQ